MNEVKSEGSCQLNSTTNTIIKITLIFVNKNILFPIRIVVAHMSERIYCTFILALAEFTLYTNWSYIL